MTIEQQVQQAAELAKSATPGLWTAKKPTPHPTDGFSHAVLIAKTFAGAIFAVSRAGQFPANDREFIAHCNPEFISKWAAYTRSLASLLDSVDPFSAGRDGDRCIWCNRDRPISLQTWEGRWDEEHHDTDCDAANFFAKYRATDSKGDRNNG